MTAVGRPGKRGRGSEGTGRLNSISTLRTAFLLGPLAAGKGNAQERLSAVSSFSTAWAGCGVQHSGN